MRWLFMTHSVGTGFYHTNRPHCFAKSQFGHGIPLPVPTVTRMALSPLSFLLAACKLAMPLLAGEFPPCNCVGQCVSIQNHMQQRHPLHVHALHAPHCSRMQYTCDTPRESRHGSYLTTHSHKSAFLHIKDMCCGQISCSLKSNRRSKQDTLHKGIMNLSMAAFKTQLDQHETNMMKGNLCPKLQTGCAKSR